MVSAKSLSMNLLFPVGLYFVLVIQKYFTAEKFKVDNMVHIC